MTLSSAEKLLLGMIILCLVFSLFYQTLVSQSPGLGVIERVGSDAQMVLSPGEQSDHSVILQLTNFSTLPKARVLVNGKVQGDFSHPFVTIPVTQGDLLEVDVSYYDHPVAIKVLDATQDVHQPVKGRVYTGQRTVLLIGQVQVNKP